MKIKFISFAIAFTLLACGNTILESSKIEVKTIIETNKPAIVSEIPLPEGFKRLKTTSYGNWMRNIKLTQDNIVYYYNGDKKQNQSIHVGVLDFDIGKRDLQQCADACMRIRSEYLFENKKYKEIKFLFANGKWGKSFANYTTKHTHKALRSYLNYVYSYANTASLKKQLTSVSVKDIKIGDVFVQSGNPYGHAVTVMDVCENKKGEKKFMISQSYMPAQSIEILKNPKDNTAWYSADFIGDLNTPEWSFTSKDLKRF